VKVEYKGRSRDWRVTEVVAPAGPIDVQLTETGRGGPLRGGAEYLVTVGLKQNVGAGPVSEQITLKTNDPANPLIHVVVTANIAAPLEVAPARVRMEGIAIGQSGKQRVLIRAARPFRIIGVDGLGEGVTVELPATQDKPLQVQFITVKFDRKKASALDRDLRVKTDLDGGATVTIPVEAEELK